MRFCRSNFSCLLIVTCLTSACSSLGTAQKDPDDATSLSSTSEKLLAEPPKDWRLVYEINNDKMRLSDFIPQQESKDNWHTKLSFEAHRELIEIDPITVVMGEIKKSYETCSNLTHANLYTGYENNYPTSVRLIECGEDSLTNQGEVSLTKAIQGKEYFYIVRFSKKVDSFQPNQSGVSKGEVAAWASYLSRVSLCDSASEKHPCSLVEETSEAAAQIRKTNTNQTTSDTNEPGSGS